MNPSGNAAGEPRVKYFKIAQCALQCIICFSILFGQKSLYLAECIETCNLTVGFPAHTWLFLMKGTHFLASISHTGLIWLVILPLLLTMIILGRKLSENHIDLVNIVCASAMSFLIYSFYDAWRCMVPISGTIH